MELTLEGHQMAAVGRQASLGVRWVGPASRIRISKVRAERTPRGHPGLPLFMDRRIQTQREKGLPKVSP